MTHRSPSPRCAVSVKRCERRRALPSFPTRRSSDLVLANGRRIDARAVLSNASIKSTVLELAGREHFQADFAQGVEGDRKSTRLNSSHSQITYAVLRMKKKRVTKKINGVELDGDPFP